MTYEESYRTFETLEELETEIASDIKIAMMINPDRLKHIGTAGEKVSNEKFGKEIQN